MDEITKGVFRWTAPHPEWRTRIEWGHQVASYALVCKDGLSLVDPLLPPTGSPVMREVQARLDELVSKASRLDILVSIPYHIRSSEPLYLRYRDRLPVALWGHPAVAKRFSDPATSLTPIVPGAQTGASACASGIGNPRRYETPLYFPDHRALIFGDAVICIEGELRVWQERPFSPSWYRDKLLPTLVPLLDLDVGMVLATHGEPLLRDGRAALRRAFESPAWGVR
jgi:hypothetical protein